MTLITKVKAGSISSLSDARYFAGMGVEWLGFDVNPDSPSFVSPQLYRDLIGWVSVPGRVAELGDSQGNFSINEIVNNYQPDFLQVNLDSVKHLKGLTDVAFIGHVDIDSSKPDQESIKLVDYLIIQTSSPQKHVDLFRSISNQADILLQVSPDINDVKVLIDDLKLAGIALLGSNETKVGLKEYNYSVLLETLEDI